MSSADPIVIAHRGASGYLPEHSLESKAMAHAMGAHFIEQDVVLTRDSVPIVLHDIYLEPTTDVAQRFPERAREDGHYYALDFSLAEIRQLRLHERSYLDSNRRELAYYPQRFPLGKGEFRLPTLAEEIALIAGLDQSRSKTTGLYIELKGPRWHAAQGYDIGSTVLDLLRKTGYADRPSQVFLQCFDDLTLQQLRDKTSLPMIQLIGDNSWGEDGGVDYEAMRSPHGIEQVSRYAQGIGPWIPQVVEHGAAGWQSTGLTEMAHRHQLLVHPYTLRVDELPAGAGEADDLHRALFDIAAVDGLFSDFPDLTLNFLAQAS